MLFSEGRFEAYAMSVQGMSQTKNQFSVDVDELAQALAPLGFTPLDCQFYSGLLEDEGWATLLYPEPNKLRVKLTLRGYREIEKLYRQPRWRRWLEKNGTLWIAILALLVGVASFLQRFFF